MLVYKTQHRFTAIRYIQLCRQQATALQFYSTETLNWLFFFSLTDITSSLSLNWHTAISSHENQHKLPVLTRVNQYIGGVLTGPGLVALCTQSLPLDYSCAPLLSSLRQEQAQQTQEYQRWTEVRMQQSWHKVRKLLSQDSWQHLRGLRANLQMHFCDACLTQPSLLCAMWLTLWTQSKLHSTKPGDIYWYSVDTSASAVVLFRVFSHKHCPVYSTAIEICSSI